MDTPPPSAPVVEIPAVYPTPRQRRLLWNALTAVAAISLLAVAALTFYGFITFLSWSYPILLPIGLAVIIALVLEPIVDFVQRRGMSRETATLTVCILSVISFLLFWAFIVPPLVDQAGGFFKSLPNIMSKGVAKLDASLAVPPPKSPLQLNPTTPAPLLPGATNQLAITEPPPPQHLELPMAEPEEDVAHTNANAEILAWLKVNLPIIQETVQKNVANMMYSAMGPVGQAFGFILGFGFVPIYVYYFLADQDRIANHWHELVPMRQSRMREEVISVMTEINLSLVSYFRGQIIVAACREFAVVVTAAVMISGFISLTLTPMMCSLFCGTRRSGSMGVSTTRSNISSSGW